MRGPGRARQIVQPPTGGFVRRLLPFVLLGLVSFPGVASSETTFIELKGTLTNTAGEPSGQTTLNFRLCRGGNPAQAGTCGGGLSVYLEQDTVTPDPVTGDFSVRIGLLTALPMDVFDTNEALYLETSVGPTNPVLLLPRKAVLAGADYAANLNGAEGYSIRSTATVAGRGLNLTTGSFRVSVPGSSPASAALWLAQNAAGANGIWAF